MSDLADPHWERIWRHRKRARGMVYGLLAASGMAAILGSMLPPGRLFWGIALALLLADFVAVLAGGWQLTSWPCPRCGGRFYSRWWYLGVGALSDALKCSHCGLPWSDAREAQRAPA